MVLRGKEMKGERDRGMGEREEGGRESRERGTEGEGDTCRREGEREKTNLVCHFPMADSWWISDHW